MGLKLAVLSLALGLVLGIGIAYAASVEVVREVPASVMLVAAGDLNGDGMVDGGDLRRLAAGFNTPNPDLDINSDGRVDILDLAIVAANLHPR